MMILTITGRELKHLFLSPLAWCVLAVIQFIVAWMFLVQVDNFLKFAPTLAGSPNAPGVTDAIAAPIFSTAAIVMLLVVPIMSMRLIAEERRSGTLSLLFSAPVSMTEIVLGKYLGLLIFLLIMLGLITLMPLSLAVGTHLDYGKLFAGVLGLALLLGAFAAAGLFISTLTRQPVVAAVSSFGLLLLLWIISWAGSGSAEYSPVFHYLSLVDHYSSLLTGSFNSTDVIYYLLFIVTFLVLGIRRLDAYRLQH
ncbi:MAG: ABC transporter permease subunit [Gammaproteobacteria bacterium]|nr:ABC transporter permease subunit [Gammaproteobacteria bacterium]MDE2460445.1 ABC transporter permease subunit [Gammaproteobacteria bacterium]